jgi:anti-sigma factor RsiW
MSAVSVPLTCRELVELVTGYLEDGLSEEDRDRFARHLEACDPCVHYIEQFRLTVAAAGRIEEGDLDPAVRDDLLAAFRGWRGEGS